MTTMTLSYADMALAKEVLYGLYADTAARGQPNVPCQNEDGEQILPVTKVDSDLEGLAYDLNISLQLLPNY